MPEVGLSVLVLGFGALRVIQQVFGLPLEFGLSDAHVHDDSPEREAETGMGALLKRTPGPPPLRYASQGSAELSPTAQSRLHPGPFSFTASRF